jgi:hypothetical protein
MTCAEQIGGIVTTDWSRGMADVEVGGGMRSPSIGSSGKALPARFQCFTVGTLTAFVQDEGV